MNKSHKKSSYAKTKSHKKSG